MTTKKGRKRMEINIVEALDATQEILKKDQAVPFGKYSSVYVSPTGKIRITRISSK